jgi:DNA-binding GntR family transcriptional regulator
VSGGPPINKASLSTQIAALLRREIVDGNRAPGSRLIIDELAQAYGVSPIPVRDALREVEAEGLIVRGAQRGLFVADVTLSEIHDLFEFRAWLEAPAAVAAAANRTPEDVANVEDLWNLLQEHSRTGVWEPEGWNAHQRVHQALLLPGCGAWAARSLVHVYLNIERYAKLFMTHVPVAPANAQHLAMVNAFRAGDGELLRKLVLEHIPDIEQAIVVATHLADTERQEAP